MERWKDGKIYVIKNQKKYILNPSGLRPPRSEYGAGYPFKEKGEHKGGTFLVLVLKSLRLQFIPQGGSTPL